ncbi:unnamed protein product, partial [Anisakis simplex]
MKEGEHKLEMFLSRMRKQQLQTPPTEQAFKAEIAKANVRKVRESGVIVRSPEAVDSFVSPISSEGTAHNFSFASPIQNTKILPPAAVLSNGQQTVDKNQSEECNDANASANQDESLKLPLEEYSDDESDEEHALNQGNLFDTQSPPSEFAKFCDTSRNQPVNTDSAKQIVHGADQPVQNEGLDTTDLSRIQKWITATANAARSDDHEQENAISSPAQIYVTPLRGGGLLPPNFLSRDSRTLHPHQHHRQYKPRGIVRRRGLHKLSFTKYARDSSRRFKNETEEGIVEINQPEDRTRPDQANIHNDHYGNRNNFASDQLNNDHGSSNKNKESLSIDKESSYQTAQEDPIECRTNEAQNYQHVQDQDEIPLHRQFLQ